MKPNNVITKYYLFIGECLAFYFFLVPILSLLNIPIPFWSYLMVILFSSVLLFFSIRLVKKYIIYVVDFVLLLLFMVYLIGFSWIASVILSLFIVGRFIVHENERVIEKQYMLIGTMLFLFTIDILFFYDSRLVWMALIYLFVMVIGYQLSQIFIEGEAYSYPSLQFPLWFSGIVATGSVALFCIFYFSNASLLSLWKQVSINTTGESDFEMSIPKRIGIFSNINVNDSKAYDYGSHIPEFITWIGQIAFILGFIVIIIFLVRKKIVQQSSTSTKTKVFSSNRIKEKEQIEQKKRKTLFSRKFTNKPTNRIRRKVYQFEQLAKRKGKGRETSETIENWFDRYGVEASYLDLYQKVRYGVGELTEEEALQFEDELIDIKKKMEL